MAEQNFKQAMRIADFGHIIVHGEIVFKGDVDTLMNNDLVKSYYLGIWAQLLSLLASLTFYRGVLDEVPWLWVR